MPAIGGGDSGVEGLNKKGDGLMDTDNSVVITVERGLQGVYGNGKNTINFFKKRVNCAKTFPKHMENKIP